MKVVVIGAGIAGLTFGLACQHAGFEVKIFEKASKLTTIGGGLLLWPHGLRYLEDLGLLDCLQSIQMSVRAMNIVGHRGQAVYSEAHAELYSRLDGGILPVDRSELQHRLVALLNSDTLLLGRKCTSIENYPDYVKVSFADGTEEIADLVIGADGIHSAVRQAVNPAAVPAYTGFCWWGGIVDRAYVPHFPANEVQFILGQNKLCFIWPTSGEKFMWYLPVKMPFADYNQQMDSQLQAAEICSGWHTDVTTLITSPQSAERFYLPIYELKRDEHIAFGRTVLIGDAACATGPLLGQGANRAIEDAYVLIKLLQQSKNNIADTLLCYDNLRRARHRRFFELEHMSADALMHDTIESLMYFEEQLPNINLIMMYQDMIPLVNRAAFEKLMLEV